MSKPENEKCSSSSAESDLSDVLKRGSSTLCEEHLPKCSSDWNCHLVNKLCVRYKLEDIIRIIWSEWRLFHLDDDDRLEIERCVNACDLKLNYESLQDIAPNTTTPIDEFAETWGPTQRQLRLIQAEPLLDKYVFYSFYKKYMFQACRKVVIKVNVAGRLIHCLGLNLFSKFIVEHLARDTGSADSDYGQVWFVINSSKNHMINKFKNQKSSMLLHLIFGLNS